MVDVINLDKQHERLEKLRKTLSRDLLGDITQDAYDKAKDLAARHHVTGKLEHNLTHRVRYNEMTGYVYVQNDNMLVNWRGRRINYAVFVHFGTRPHDIKPKNAKALRWVGGDGLFHFAKVVEHPGYKGDPFLYKAGDYARKRLEKIIRRLTNEI